VRVELRICISSHGVWEVTRMSMTLKLWKRTKRLVSSKVGMRRRLSSTEKKNSKFMFVVFAKDINLCLLDLQ